MRIDQAIARTDRFSVHAALRNLGALQEERDPLALPRLWNINVSPVNNRAFLRDSAAPGPHLDLPVWLAQPLLIRAAGQTHRHRGPRSVQHRTPIAGNRYDLLRPLRRVTKSAEC